MVMRHISLFRSQLTVASSFSATGTRVFMKRKKLGHGNTQCGCETFESLK